MASTFHRITFYFTAWMDKKPVHLLSTISSAISTCLRQVKQGAEAAAGWTRIHPAIIKIYNKFMGGTDGFDWRIASFRPKITTKSWVPKGFFPFSQCRCCKFLLYLQMALRQAW